MLSPLRSLPVEKWGGRLGSVSVATHRREVSFNTSRRTFWRAHRLIRWYDLTESSSTMRCRRVGMVVLPLSKPRRRGYRRIRGNLDQAAETQVGGCPRLFPRPTFPPWQSRSGGGNSGRWVSPTFPRRARRRFGRRGSSFDRRTMSRQGGLVGYPVRGDRYRAPRRHRDWIHRSRISRSRIEPRAVSGSTARPFWRISRRPAATSRRAARRTGSR